MIIELYIKRENLWYYVADKVSEPLNPLEHGYHASNLGIIRQMVKNDIYSPNFKAIASFFTVSPMHPPGPLTGLLCIAKVLRPKVLKFATHDCKWFLDYNLELQV